jgi:1A family penicillin-binding protein
MEKKTTSSKSKRTNAERRARLKASETKFFETMPAALPGLLPLIPSDATTSKEHTSTPSQIHKLSDALTTQATVVGRSALDLLKHMAARSWHVSKVTTRALISKPARITYYSLFVIGAISATLMGISFVDNTHAKYASFINDPITLLNNKNTGTTILDRNGKVLYQVHGASTRVQASINDMPKSLINATLAAEDPKFYEQPAISWRGTARAIYKDILHREAIEGGSTLTQQLVKNTLLAPNRSFLRKAQEIVLATRVEKRYTKDEIMEMYLNGIYYGQGSYGVGAASKTYFKKDYKDLTLSESALLAGLPLGPSRFDPTADPSLAKQRRDYVLGRMQSLGLITQEQEDTAKQEPIIAYARQIGIQAPGFVFFVLDQLREQYGDDTLKYGGLTVYTTLDLDKQRIGENIVSSQIGRLVRRNVTNGALVSLNPKNGEILSMVGSANYNDPNFGAINMTTSLRQPGSSIKPLVYLSAFTKGYTPATVVDDLPVTYKDGTGVYQPNNYDMKWRGKITLREALGNSLNIPAIHVLEHIGIPEALSFMRKLGITTLSEDASRYGLSLTLGSAEVKMIDLAAAYGVFANQGKSVTPIAIKQVLNRTGKDITKKPTTEIKQLVDPRYVAMLTSILSDDNARKMEFGLNSPLRLSRPAAAKTGTTTDFRDNWTAGYTPDIVTVTWAGNANNSQMNNVDGITGAAPIWHEYMEAVLAGTPVINFETPPGMTSVRLCKRDGGLANPWDSNSVTETIPNELIPTKKCATQAPPPPPPTPEPPKPKPEEPRGIEQLPDQPTTVPIQPACFPFCKPEKQQ